MKTLVAAGMMSPTAVTAADLNTNLVANGSFENVSFGTTGGYGGPMILDWTAGTQSGFAYSHNGTSGIPDYANGGPLAGGGNWYFSTNSASGGTAGNDVDAAGEVSQIVNVAAGATGTQIATGEAVVRLSGFFSGYLTNGDYGHLHVEFLNGANASLGTTEITNLNETDTWREKRGVGFVPVGTASLRVSVFGTPLSGGPDGYIDNVDVRVKSASSELVYLEVNTSNGQVRLRNQTGAPVNIDYYEITSATSALNATSWNSLQEQNLAGFPAGNGSGNGWEQAGGSSSSIVSESYLLGSSSLANEAALNLGAAFTIGGAQNLAFRYGALASAPTNPVGDYNNDGTVNAADYTRWRDSLGQSVTLPNDSTPGTVSQADYNVWKTNFGQTATPSGPSILTTGFVRYVTAFSGAGAVSVVPEPTSVILVGVCLGTLAVGSGRRRGGE